MTCSSIKFSCLSDCVFIIMSVNGLQRGQFTTVYHQGLLLVIDPIRLQTLRVACNACQHCLILTHVTIVQ